MWPFDRISRLWNGSKSGALARGSSTATPELSYNGSNVGLLLNEVFPGEVKSLTPGDTLSALWVGKPKWSMWNTEAAINQGYKAISWVYVCCSKTALAISQLPWQVQKISGDRWENVEKSHPLQQLLDNPNPWWSSQELVYRIVLELLLGGNSIVTKVRAGGIPVELFTLRPQHIAPIPSRTKYISNYVVALPDGKKRYVAPEDVIHIQLPDPGWPFWGMSPLQAAARVIDIENDAQTWQKVSLQNFMVPPGLIQVKGHINAQQFEQERERLRKEYTGALNARRPLLMGGGGLEAVWKQMSLTPQEVDFINTRKLSREEICAIIGTPPPIVGILDHSTYNNISTAKEIWWEDSLTPLGGMIENAINRALAPEFGDDLRAQLDKSKVVALLAAVMRRIEAVKELTAMGVPFNDASEFVALGLTHPGGDVGYLPVNMVPVSSIGAATEEEMKGWFAHHNAHHNAAHKDLDGGNGKDNAVPDESWNEKAMWGKGSRAQQLNDVFKQMLSRVPDADGDAQ